VQGEISLHIPSTLFNKGLPEHSACGVVGEGEVNRAVKELFEVFLTSFHGQTGAPDDRNSGLIGDPLGSPLNDGLLNASRVGRVILLCLFGTLALFLFTREHFFALINIDDGRSVSLGSLHHHGDHLVTLSLTGSVLAKSGDRAQVED